MSRHMANPGADFRSSSSSIFGENRTDTDNFHKPRPKPDFTMPVRVARAQCPGRVGHGLASDIAYGVG